MKKFINRLMLSFLIGFSITGVFVTDVKSEQQNIASSVFRLHILANSDKTYDQELKLKVRDEILVYLSDFEDPKTFAEENLRKLEEIAEKVIIDNGYNYNVEAEIGDFDFPTKTYGEISLPAGIYNALRVKIGSSKGQNWWCVIYPNICVQSNQTETLKENLSKEDYDIITGKSPLKFRVIELFK